MRRDDALVLLLLAAEPLGYTLYNATQYGFCIDRFVSYDFMFSQMSWEYPYCDTEREILLMHSPDFFDDPIGNVPVTALYWMQRRMDVNQRVHFLDFEDEWDFCLINH
jgi:hypothetical protein